MNHALNARRFAASTVTVVALGVAAVPFAAASGAAPLPLPTKKPPVVKCHVVPGRLIHVPLAAKSPSSMSASERCRRHKGNRRWVHRL
jgi:hypothetical protein